MIIKKSISGPKQESHIMKPPSTSSVNTDENNTTSIVNVPLGNESGEKTEEDQSESKGGCYKKAAIAIILVGFISFVIADSLTNGYVKDSIDSFLEWIEDNPAAGIFAFMAVYFVATVLFIPGSILTLGAGFVFANTFGLGAGVLLGTLSVFIGAGSGAVVSFLLGRYLLRDWVSGLTKKYTLFEALDNAFEEKGLRIMVLLRLSPIIPFNAINYIAGVTAISFWAYFWALIAILPGTVLYVFLGASAGSLTDSASSGDDSTVTIIVVVVGIVFGVLAIAATSYYAKKELNKVAERRQAEMDAAVETAEDNERTVEVANAEKN